MIKVILGILLALISLWGTSYAMHIGDSWILFPAYLTGSCGFFAGIGLACYKVIK
jgi:hypothetical protein